MLIVGVVGWVVIGAIVGFIVSKLVNLRGDKIIRERIYVAEGWEPPEWRAKWRSATPADPHI